MVGIKPKGQVKIKWSANFAYAIGLIVTDGSLSKNKKSISFTSKDFELVDHFQKALGVNLKFGKKSSGSTQEKKYFVVQIGDVLFYRFLQSIGLMSNKTKIIGEVKIPKKYFADFLRGLFDGDGSTYSYFDPRWRSSYMFYTGFCSASKKHIYWLKEQNIKNFAVRGHITKTKNLSCYQLKYAKAESLIVLKKMYYKKSVICLSRKRLKIDKMLAIIGKTL